MKKLLYSLLTLAAALTVTSCLKEVEGGSVYDDGTLVDATFAVTLGPQTKAFADGKTATELYAGLYEVDNIESPTTFTHVAHSDAQSIDSSTGKGKVEFPAGLQRGKSYAVFFWAEASGAPYTIDWAAEGTKGPSVTVTTSGSEVVANDENRDAFTGVHVFGPVSESVNTEDDPSLLRRPFAQINILVPNENVDVLLNALADGERRSSMTVSGLPNKLFLATGATEGNVDYEFLANNIKEAAFGKFADTHQYMAMNYVLYGAADTNYPVTFSVVNKEQTATNKTISVPLKVNTRTNIVGNIFADNFDYSGWVSVTPGLGNEEVEEEIRSITITVGGMQISSLESVAVGATSVLQLDFPGTVNGSITATSSDEGVAKVSVEGKQVTVKGVADGVATITIVIPAGTKADYAARTVKVNYKVGNGGDQTPTEQVATPTFSPGSGAVAANTEVTISCETAGAKIHYTVDGSEPDSESTLYNPESKPVIDKAKTIKAIAIKDDYFDSEIATAAYTIATTPVEKANRNLAFSAETASVFVGATNQYPTLSGVTTDVVYSVENVTPEGCIAINAETGAITINAAGTATVKASAAETAEYKAGEASYALTAVTPTFSVSPASFEVAANAQTVTVNITSNQAWQVECTSPVTADPASGEGDGTVTFSFPENTEASPKLYQPIIAPVSVGDPVTVEISVAGKVVEDNGDGTLAKPFNIAGVKAYIDGNGSENVYVKGKISRIDSGKEYSESYGTAVFYISDDGETTSDQFEAFSIYYLGNKSWVEGNTQIALGDNVVLYGKVTKYGDTYETSSKAAYLYSLNEVQGLPAITLTENTKGDNSDKTITVEWTSVSGATAYEVVCGTLNYSAGANETSHTFTMEDYGTYDVKVTATATGFEKSIVKSSVAISNPDVSYVWVATALTSITSSNEFVIVGKSGDNYYALSNNNGTSSAPDAIPVTVSDGKISGEVATTIVWTLSVSEESYTFYPNDDTKNWLYCTNSNNGVRVGTNTNKVFTLEESGYLKHTGTSRFVGIYDNSDWRCYTSINDNIKNQTFTFYVKKEASN